ncbi:hypothetical protein [Schaalia canis]|uniref:Uncharacterized protein n=1 Tax=Schaalia canis TaxID=100469 RepID=A0A3P1SCI5_9ACTO|nr:hypothetical protein [Schaalia canis]RRC94610.1 hypothetical protein EII11_09260 [Schaalia canis]
MSVENTQRDDETTVLPVADEEETVILPAAESDSDSISAGTVTADGDSPDNPAGTQADSPTLEAPAPTLSDDGVPSDKPGASAQPFTGTPDAPRPDIAPDAPATPAAPAAAPTSAVSLKESPANGVRVAQLVWAGLVIMLGIFMIAISFLRFVSIPLLLISLIAALGIALMAAAVVTSVKKG